MSPALCDPPGQAAAQLRCAYCHDQLVEACACEVCGSRLHAECFLELGRCPSLGCRGSRRAEEAQPGRRDPLRPPRLLPFWLGLSAFVAGLCLLITAPPFALHVARAWAGSERAARAHLAAARLLAATGREQAAITTLEDFYLHFVSDDVDWTSIEEHHVSKYYKDQPIPERFVFWLETERGRVEYPPLQPADSETQGEALLLLARLLDEEREYVKSSHLYTCLVTFQPEGSATHEAARAARARWLIRQF